MPDFLLYALIAGLTVAVVAGPLGTLVVWQRLAYFGDTLAHSALSCGRFCRMASRPPTSSATPSTVHQVPM